MNAKIICLFVLFTLLLSNTCAWAQADFDKKRMVRKNEPIQIVSNKLEAFQEKRMVIFSGNAVATQGDVRIVSDRMLIYSKKSDDKKEKNSKQDMDVSGDLEKIELKGHVVITQKDLSATGDDAVYFQDTAQFIMTGNPVLKQGQNVIKGCKVTIYIDEKRGKVEPCDTINSGRVSAVIHPQDKDKDKNKDKNKSKK